MLKFQRSSISLVHDARRLEEGQDLNDAMMDFFVKLGQALVPSVEKTADGSMPPVAYLGSLFYDQLRKGGAENGRAGHANVANWAKRRLGKGGLFSDAIGALAIPVNEMLKDDRGQEEGKHWWLALLLNPHGAQGSSLLCLDSLARVDKHYDPPHRTIRDGTLPAYPLDVINFSRQGPVGIVTFRAQGDGSSGPIADPQLSRLRAPGKTAADPYNNLTINEPGADDVPGEIEGTLEFDLGSTCSIAGDYSFEFGGPGLYQPISRFRLQPESTPFQKEVGSFMGGYLAQEWDTAMPSADEDADPSSNSWATFMEGRVLRPDVPQQENANDCGYFILEQILLVLQLPPATLRALAQAPANSVGMLPWPSQEQISHRKIQLKEALGDMFQNAFQHGTSDVEVLFEKNPELRAKLRAYFVDSSEFAKEVEQGMANSWQITKKEEAANDQKEEAWPPESDAKQDWPVQSQSHNHNQVANHSWPAETAANQSWGSGHYDEAASQQWQSWQKAAASEAACVAPESEATRQKRKILESAASEAAWVAESEAKQQRLSESGTWASGELAEGETWADRAKAWSNGCQ